MKKQIIIYISTFLFLLLTTLGFIFYGKGYIFNFEKGKIEISVNGLLAATSQPDGAGIYINNHLTSATNNAISLSPGEFDVKIAKDGYFPWKKKIKIEKEVVTTAYALLFPTAPKLENITDTGVGSPVIDPSRTKIAYTISSFDSPRKNGIYILDMTLRPILTLRSASSQVADDTIDIFSQSLLSWSPDSRELLATISGETDSQTTYLLKTSFNENPQDVTATLQEVKIAWENDNQALFKSRMFGLPPKLKTLINEDFKILAWSPDETKILYVATRSANLPLIINPRLIGANSTPEERSISKDGVYVYDLKEDKNFRIDLDSSQLPLSWFSDSKHLIYVNDKKINIMEYDAQNRTTIYAGPFIDDYVFPWPDGSSLVMLTNLGNQNIVPNLYTIGLK
ncbi:MAG: PEGA domain-containing protein [Patescibacteria group bacterium]